MNYIYTLPGYLEIAAALTKRGEEKKLIGTQVVGPIAGATGVWCPDAEIRKTWGDIEDIDLSTPEQSVDGGSEKAQGRRGKSKSDASDE